VLTIRYTERDMREYCGSRWWCRRYT